VDPSVESEVLCAAILVDDRGEQREVAAFGKLVPEEVAAFERIGTLSGILGVSQVLIMARSVKSNENGA
jgi:hypothetical protein